MKEKAIIHIDKKLHTRVKVACAKTGVTISAFVEKAISDAMEGKK